MSLPEMPVTPADSLAAHDAVTPTSIGFRLAKGAELVSGYVLQERIGIGGYGEVWSATAPGGITKAVKVLFGRLEESRAAHELKAIYRVKGLRHPFLLTLERIETVDGHLVVVTEMADSNLKERYDACRQSGLPGVPREELLQYLEEAAEALDYLADTHSLQHLDVKPENLLLVSNHVKVGDYGLLKDLRDVSVSLVGGLTPRYASPEVFDGRPSRRSDQYSLAIVFQEMATGELPFDGRTSASLAAQHVHSAPNLAGLTAQERFAVGKALSKDPVRRFGSCREFVARLKRRGTATILTGIDNVRTPGAGTVRSADERSGAEAKGAVRRPSGFPTAAVHDGQTIVVKKPETASLPAISLDQKTPTYRPTVFIGIGGTGGKVLSRLRRLLTDGVGDAASCPALQMLYIDTDVSSINEASIRSIDGTLREHETIVAPLRQTWHYRNSPLGSLPSLSRRWIYNIPRSLRTEGMRALGRLALLDHSKQILSRLRSAVLAAVDNEAVQATAASTGLEFAETDPRIFIVASIAGGTGGGMVLDTAYAVRQVLAEEGWSDEHVCGLLMYSSDNHDAGRNLAAASAYACLQEMQYFSVPGCDYPGEPRCGLAGFREAGSAFKNTYLIDLGDNADDDEFSRDVDRIATYLLLNSASSASVFFDTCRAAERDEHESGEFRMRTMGLASLKADTQDVPPQWGDILAKAVVRRWQGGGEAVAADDRIRMSDYARLFDACDGVESGVSGLEERASQQLAELGVEPQQLVARAGEQLCEQLGSDVDSYLTTIVSESISASSLSGAQTESLVAGVVRRLHAIAGVHESPEPALADRLNSLRDLGTSIARQLGHEVGSALQAWILNLADSFEAHAAAAQQTAEWMAGRFESVEAELHDQLARAEAGRTSHLDRLFQLSADTKANRRSGRAACIDGLDEYCGLLARETLLGTSLKAVRAIRPYVTATSDRLRELWRDLNRLSEQFAVESGSDVPTNASTEGDVSAEHFFTPLANVFTERRQEMIEQLAHDVQESFFGERLALRQVFAGSRGVREELIECLRQTARDVILRYGRDAVASRLGKALSGNDVEGLLHALEQASLAAEPRLFAPSAAKRLLLAVPNGLDRSRLAAEVKAASGVDPTAISGCWREAILCCEVEQLTLDEISARFLRSRSDCESLAARLHARIDVNW